MWGITFRKAKNSLLVITGEFEVSHRSGPSEIFHFADGPHGGWLDKLDNMTGEWERVAGGMHVREAIENVLPKEFGYDWTWEGFLVALTFWGEGEQCGRYHP